MPISYIDIFRPVQQDGVSQILSSGVNALTGALNNAIAIGRDQASLRATQERDYLAERERNENLVQRRVEMFQTQANTDRSFAESVLRDRRDTTEENKDDDRDYKFKVDTDIRDAGVRRENLDSLLVDRTSTRELAEKKFELDREETEVKKETLKQRKDDILKQYEPKSWYERLLSGPAKPANPDMQIAQGQELKKISLETGDTATASRADKIVDDALTKKAEQRIQNILATRSSLRRPAKTEADKLEEVEDNIAALNDPRIVEDNDLSQARIIELVKLEKERERLRRKLGVAAPVKVESLAEQLRRKYQQSKPPGK